MESLAALHSFSATTTSISFPYSRSSLLHRSPPKQPRFSSSTSLSSSFRPLRSPLSAPPLRIKPLFPFNHPSLLPARCSKDQSSSSPTPPPPVQGAKLVPLVVSVGIGLIVRFAVARPAAVTPQAWQLLSIFLSTIAGLVLSPLPVGAWAFLGLTTSIVTKTLSFSAAFSAFTSEVIWLIVISFFFARGFVKTGLGDRIATYFVKWLGKSTLGLSYGLTISEALIAPAMPSTTARAGGVFLPIIKSLSLSAGSKPGDPSSKKLGSYLLMSQFQSAGNSSALFLTAAAQNLLCLKLAEELGVKLSSPWVSWFKAASLPAIVCLLVTPLVLYKIFPPEIKDTPDAPALAAKKLEQMGPVTKNAATKPPAASHQNTRGHTSQQTRPERVGSNSHGQPEETFWTCCQSCKVKFQYHAQYRNKMLKCHICDQHFVAREVVVTRVPPRSDYFGSASHPGVNIQGSGNVAPQSNGGKSTFAGVELRPDGGKVTSVNGKPKSKESKAGNVGGIYNYFKPQVKADEQVSGGTGKKSGVDMSAAGRPSRSSSKKRPNTREEISGDDEFVAPPSKRSQAKKSSAGYGQEMEKPSGPKQEPERYTEEILHGKTSRAEGIQASEDEVSISDKPEANGSDSGRETELDQEHIQCPDAEFTDFEKDKSENCFKVNQVWALYDEIDSMPRFYARVKKVLSPGFKLLITWLEASPGTKEEECWEEADLPISCGTFVNGESDKIGDHLMFSHRMDCRRGKGKGTFVIYPKKGETWALFKDWDIKWGAEPDKHKPPYCFDFVEILSDFTEESGVMVACLDKVEGFVSIFERSPSHEKKVTSFRIKRSELYRFSHRIPSREMTGMESLGVPVSFELDTAALPSNLYSRDDIKQQAQAEEVHCSKEATSSKPARTPQESHASRINEISPEGSVVCGLSAGLPSDIHIEDDPKGKDEQVEYGEPVLSTPRRSTRGLRKGNGNADVNANQPVIVEGGAWKRKDPSASTGNHAQTSGLSESDSDFNIKSRKPGGSSACLAGGMPVSSAKLKVEAVKYDFNKERSAGKFKTGQVWAIFSKEAGMMPKDYAVVKKIEYAPTLTMHVAMLESPSYPIGTARPFSCGTFTEGSKTTAVSVAQFSHLVSARATGKNRYLIWPTEGEIWAVYKSSESEQCDGDGEFEIVKVLEGKDESVKVVTLTALTKRSGLKSFYKAPQSQRLKVGEMEIPFKEINRFSHRCAAYYHEANGCWEVESSSVTCQVTELE